MAALHEQGARELASRANRLDWDDRFGSAVPKNPGALTACREIDC
jgi:hypothetical protein